MEFISELWNSVPLVYMAVFIPVPWSLNYNLNAFYVHFLKIALGVFVVLYISGLIFQFIFWKKPLEFW